MTGTAHSRSAYLALPDGWRVAPPGAWADLMLWRQFFAQPEIRAATLPVATTIQFPADVHRHRSAADRQESFDRWARFARSDDARAELHRLAARAGAENLLGLLEQIDELRDKEELSRRSVIDTASRLDAAETALTQLRASRSWRMTAPLRAVGHAARGALRGRGSASA
jgi:hypothetical protein